jgi:hypothetical protein
LPYLWHERGDHRFDGVFGVERVVANATAVIGTVGSARDEIVAQVEASGVNYLEPKVIFGDIGRAAATATPRPSPSTSPGGA